MSKQAKIEANFSALIVSIAHAALLAMGIKEDPNAKDIPKDRRVATHNIDLLLILKEKTKGNLNEEETKLLDYVISDLQMKFIQTKE